MKITLRQTVRYFVNRCRGWWSSAWWCWCSPFASRSATHNTRDTRGTCEMWIPIIISRDTTIQPTHTGVSSFSRCCCCCWLGGGSSLFTWLTECLLISASIGHSQRPARDSSDRRFVQLRRRPQGRFAYRNYNRVAVEQKLPIRNAAAKDCLALYNFTRFLLRHAVYVNHLYL